ncbi:FMN reductase [Xanthomonas campestris]|uniref:FMN reductase n=1 Tax=Xanthomonas campestris TaxID=339 RepID=UPI001E5AACD6|nr:FMN reductase [Xanthomonas campestris]MCC4602731.1 FMN reductase [Xanthomonas campestris pv. parthenii]
MRTPLNVVAVSGSTSRPSRSLALAEATLAELAQHLAIKPSILQLGEIARPLGAAQWRSDVDATTEQALRQIETADLLLVVAPVYRGSYPGLLKHLFDLIDMHALIDTPVLLAATGGSERHALVIDHQLRPLFAFFQALTLPIGIHASESDFHDYQVAAPALRQRIALAAERAAGVLGVRPDARLRIA